MLRRKVKKSAESANFGISQRSLHKEIRIQSLYFRLLYGIYRSTFLSTFDRHELVGHKVMNSSECVEVIVDRYYGFFNFPSDFSSLLLMCVF